MSGKASSQRSESEQAIAYTLYRISRLLRHDLITFLGASDTPLRPEQYFLLFQIARRGNGKQRELADPALLDHSNVTRLLDGLEQAGLVKREPSRSDRRATIVTLTEKGARVVTRLSTRVKRERRHVFDGLTERQLQTLDRSLEIIQSNLEDGLQDSRSSGKGRTR